ncbi:MAG: hypothetical protein JSS24_05775 [Proteobacteria bacterium]|nr:hypothetical protein [Pseudomonadota bacterium]
MKPVLQQDLLATVASSKSRAAGSAVVRRLHSQALELVAAEDLGRASFMFRIRSLQGVEGPVLVVESERLEAPWLLPSTGTLTALACGVCTLGVALEERVRTLFAQGKRSLALALDSLGNELLFEVSARMRHRMMRQTHRQGLTLSGELRSGDPGLALETQPLVLRLAEAERIGVTASRGAVLHPLKSMSCVFGVGIDLPEARWSRCDTCRSRERCSIAPAT